MSLQNPRWRDSTIDILGAILHQGIVSQKDLESLTGLSRITISKEIKNLERRRFIKYVRILNKDTYGRPRNHWKLTFRGILAIFLECNDEDKELVVKKHRNEWVIFHEWKYIKKDPLVWNYIRSKIMDFVLERRGWLETVFEPDLFKDIDIIKMQSTRERERIHEDLDGNDKHLLLRNILGLHRLFYSKDDLSHGGWWETKTILPYLIQNKTFRKLYENELDLLKLKYKQLLMVSEIFQDPSKAEEVSNNLFFSQLDDVKK